eukprot:1161524-Pelagomonas_calceolata.AAC.11
MPALLPCLWKCHCLCWAIRWSRSGVPCTLGRALPPSAGKFEPAVLGCHIKVLCSIAFDSKFEDGVPCTLGRAMPPSAGMHNKKKNYGGSKNTLHVNRGSEKPNTEAPSSSPPDQACLKTLCQIVIVSAFVDGKPCTAVLFSFALEDAVLDTAGTSDTLMVPFICTQQST